MSENIFEQLLQVGSLFRNRRALSHAFTPATLPHRDAEVRTLVHNLVEALRGHPPSDMILYGAPGSGKTAVTRHVCEQLETKGAEIGKSVSTVQINCRTIDTKYRVLTEIANGLRQADDELVPFTGWPADRVFETVRERMDRAGGVHVIVLDEIDHLVRRTGNDLLYNLTSLNIGLLENAFCCIIGISNDLQFTDMLDPRVTSRMAPIDVNFNPYNATQLEDILSARAREGVSEGALADDVIPLCAALAAKEHGDARRALDLLRVSIQKAEQSEAECVEVGHVNQAQNQLEFDQITPAVAGLPLHEKLVLASVMINERNGLRNIAAGEVTSTYESVCMQAGERAKTTRSGSNYINRLEMLGLVTVRLTSFGRHGRSRRINTSLPASLDAEAILTGAEPIMNDVFAGRYRLQGRL